MFSTRTLADTAPTRGSSNGSSQCCMDPYWITELASVIAMNSPRAMRMPILSELGLPLRRGDGKDPYPVTVPALARGSECSAPRNGHAIIVRVIIDEYDLEIRIAAQQCPT